MKNSILDLIQQGENSAIEFKNASVTSDSLSKELVSFSNSGGGTVLIGIEDDKTITGIDSKSKNWEEWLQNICRDTIIPPINNLQFDIVKFYEKEVGIIEVPKGIHKPYQTHKNQYLVRVGSTNRYASQSELMRLFQQSGMFHFDLTAIVHSSIRNLDYNKLHRYFERYNLDFNSEEDKIRLLINTDILTETGEMTIAGNLLFGISPQKWMPNASISFAHFVDNTITSELIDKKNIEGTLDSQIDQLMTTLQINLLKGSEIKGAKTVDTHIQYPEKVFREIIVNACIHRNYSLVGSRIRVFMFSDRLEFISPGRLPNTVTIPKMLAGVSYSNNPVILKFMENMRYVDKLGRGIPLVAQECKKMNKELLIEEIGEEFKVTLEL